MTTNIIMPEMGEGVAEGTVVQWLKQEGDLVEVDDALLEIETDKVTVEVPAEIEGTLLKINVAEGQTVKVGTVLAIIGEENETVAESKPVTTPAKINTKTTPESSSGHPDPEPAPRTYSRSIDNIRLSPLAARIVEEHNLNIEDIDGTGRSGRITKKDVLNQLEQSPPQEAKPTTETKQSVKTVEPTPTITADGELQKLSGMRRSIAEHMVQSVQSSPHAATFFEFDFSQVTKHRAENKSVFAKDGIKLTYMAYIAQATVEALRDHPMVNASWTDEGILLKKPIHLGIAVAIDDGLVVPVIQHAEDLNLRGIARKIQDFAERARANKLKPDEIKNGTFTITNHGASGSLAGTPIINQPQAGILGVGRIEKRVKVINDAIAIRPCAYISFSFDHRVLDGARADAFVMQIKSRIEKWT